MTKKGREALLPHDKRKVKRPTLKKLDTDLWEVFSKFIRLRDSKDGVAQCISCGQFIEVWRFDGEKVRWNGGCQAGHYYNQGSSYRALKYDEKNVNDQCYHCNMHLEGNKQGYREGLIKKYGEEVLEYLDVKKRNQTTYNRFVLESLLRHYKLELKKLIKEKMG